MRGETVVEWGGQAHHLPNGMRVQPDATTQQAPLYMWLILDVLLYVRAYTVVFVFSYSFMCVFVLLYMCVVPAVCVCWYCCVCVLMLLYVCADAGAHAGLHAYARQTLQESSRTDAVRTGWHQHQHQHQHQQVYI